LSGTAEIARECGWFPGFISINTSLVNLWLPRK